MTHPTRRQQEPEQVSFGTLVRGVYDATAERYDDLWSDHVRVAQARLTADLRLRGGDRLLDLACGSGVETLAMLRVAHPGEVVAVDASPNMLAIAAERAARAGLPLTTVCADGIDFLERKGIGSFDAISMRFCLAYLDADALLAAAARTLSRRGRIGVLTSLATSAPQARAAYAKLRRELLLPAVDPLTPRSPDVLRDQLERAGLEVHDLWIERPRIDFADGRAAASWLWESGYVTHPALEGVGYEVIKPLLAALARQLDLAHPSGVPLDLELLGVIAATAREPRG